MSERHNIALKTTWNYIPSIEEQLFRVKYTRKFINGRMVRVFNEKLNKRGG